MKKIKICGLIIILILLLEVITPVISQAKEVIEDKDNSESVENTEIVENTKNEENAEPAEEKTSEDEDIITAEEKNIENEEDTEVKKETTEMQETIESEATEEPIGVTYYSHVQDYGWETEYNYKNGETSGTTGRNKKIEAIRIKLINTPASSGITYRAYIQGKGWQEVKDGNAAGTIGENRKIEALQMSLRNLDKYSVRYKIHLENKGWTDWYYDGDIAGATGGGYKIEAIKIEIVEKEERTPSLEYRSHVQDYGWENAYVSEGKESGTTGRNKKIEAVKIKLKNAPSRSSIRYKTYLQGKGWQEIKNNDDIAGTTGENRKIEAIQIDLKGLDTYSTKYKVHLENKGWTDWYYDGDIAGAIGEGLKIEAIIVQITPKVERTTPIVKYRSHIQDYGWEKSYVADGETSGKAGQNKKIEATQIKLKNSGSIDSHIKYMVNLEGSGWSSWKYDGDLIGTIGQNKKIYGIRIKLENLPEYSVEYRVYINGEGWSNNTWVSDGITAGNIADKKKIEAIEVKITKASESVKPLYVEYYSHVQDYGWETEYSKQNGDTSGTTGKNKKIEAVKMRLVNAPEGANIKYRVFLQDKGWQNWNKDSEMAGTTGLNKKLYGIRIELEGLENYSIQYKAHIQDYGWTSWKYDGMTAGHPADSKKIEAIIVKLVPKATGEPIVEYYSYIQGNGWEEEYLNQNGEITGTIGKSKRIESVKLKLRNAPAGAKIKYKVHIAEIGWIDKWYEDGEEAGTPGSGKKIEAIQVQLENMSKYTIEYKSHVQDYGWQDWRQDGKASGSTGKNKRIEAFIFRIVGKYKSEFRGIDVSSWQGSIDYGSLITQDNMDFMIMRAGYGRNDYQKDSQFENNYAKAKAYGIPIGVYLYSYATDVEGARAEAYNMLNWIKGKSFELPVFYDMEDSSQNDPGRRDLNAEMCNEFCKIISKAGYQVGVYSGKYFYRDCINSSKLSSNNSLWIAAYGTNDGGVHYNVKYSEYHDIWQYTSRGSVKGIGGNVDMNICYNANYFRK